MSQNRVQRVAEAIKKEIGVIIHDELNDPRIGFITITKVELSRDLRVAKVFFSLLGSPKQLRDTQIGLSRSSGFIRRLLGQRMNLRYVPEIIMRLDKNVGYSIHISEVLDKIKRTGEENERKKNR